MVTAQFDSAVVALSQHSHVIGPHTKIGNYYDNQCLLSPPSIPSMTKYLLFVYTLALGHLKIFKCM
jgi:hypothetical protein